MKQKQFIVVFPYAGTLFVTFLAADSFEEAEAKLQAIRNHGVIEGERIHCWPWWIPMWVVNLYCRLRNLDHL